MRTKFFPERDLSSLAYVTLGLLAEGARPESELIDELKSLGWVRQGKLKTHYGHLRNLEEFGLILAFPSKTFKGYQLTSAGYELWSQYFDFCCSSIGKWTQLRQAKESSDFVTLGALPPRANRAIQKQRPPTKREQQIILDAAEPDFRRVYEFSLRSKTRTTDLENARIEGIDWDSNTLTLEERSATERLIDNRTVHFNDGARKVLEEAVGGRKSGLIFLMKSGLPWRTEYMSREFRAIRAETGLSPEVAMAGRGGKVGILTAMLEEADNGDELEEDDDDAELETVTASDEE